MSGIIDLLLKHNRVVVFSFLLIVLIGWQKYNGLSKEMSPDIKIPIMYVTTNLEGISAQDSERLLVKPMESSLASIEGVKEMRSVASEGHASVTLEFDVNFDNNKALQDVRSKLDAIRAEIPRDATSPTVYEVNLSLFPVLNITLMGDVLEQEMYSMADQLKDEIETVNEVLEAKIVGKREEVVEILISPFEIERYNLDFASVLQNVVNNNVMIPAGQIIKENGVFSLRVAGLIENVKDLINMPVAVQGDRVVFFKDIAEVRKTFKDPVTLARVNQKQAVVLEVSKKTGTSALDVIEKVKQVVDQNRSLLSENMQIIFSQDNSVSIKDNIKDLENNLIFSVLLILIIISVFMGPRPAFLVSISLPSSFLIGVIIIYYLGFTLNIVVLFALILSVGMLVDAAIVVTEYADRQMIIGKNRLEAYTTATKTVAAPVTSSVLTTMIVFLPMSFWPGMAGKFIFYLPITLAATLFGSLIISLIFLPVLGSIFGGISEKAKKTMQNIVAIENGDIVNLGKFLKSYANVLSKILERPMKSIIYIMLVSFLMLFFYVFFGKGVEFFPDIEPDNLIINVRSTGDFSIFEKKKIMMEVEDKIEKLNSEFKVVYSSIGADNSRSDSSDLVGYVQIELADWQERRRAKYIMEDILKKVSDIRGFDIEVLKESKGPRSKKPVKIQVSSHNLEKLHEYSAKLIEYLHTDNELINIEDNNKSSKITWDIVIDKERAALHNLDNKSIGNIISMATSGTKISEYRPDDSRNEVDIVLRFTDENRSLNQIKSLKIPTVNGLVPVDNFIKIVPISKIDNIYRINRMQTVTISSDLKSGVILGKKLDIISKWLQNNRTPDIYINFKGDYQDQNESMVFLRNAFLNAIIGIVLILLAQFNSFRQTLIIMTSVFFSTLGVFLGLLITFRPFGIVMSGIGLITLAGVVVNNNILLVDAFNSNIKNGYKIKQAVVMAAVSRIRAILLTAGTTVLGIMPMVFGITIDFFDLRILFNPPSSQWWTQLSSSIAGGLTFATIITLFFTPCMIYVFYKKKYQEGSDK